MCLYVIIYACLHAFLCSCVCTVFVCVCTYIYMCVCVCACICATVGMHVFLRDIRACMCFWIYAQRRHASIHMCIYEYICLLPTLGGEQASKVAPALLFAVLSQHPFL
jgi:hypothetical protein